MTTEIIRQVKHVGSRVGYFEINKIDNQGTERSYRLIKELSPELDQKRLSEFYENSKKKGNPLPVNSIELGELYTDVINSTNNNLKNYFFKALEGWGVGTLTRIVYSLKDLEHWNNCSIEECLSKDHEIYHFFETAFKDRGEDEIIHNYGTSDSFSFFTKLLGKYGGADYIEPDISNKLLGTSEIKKLKGDSFLFYGFNKIPKEFLAMVGMNRSYSIINLRLRECPSYARKSFLLEKIK